MWEYEDNLYEIECGALQNYYEISISSLCLLKVFLNSEIKYKYDVGNQNNRIHTSM